MKYYILKRTIIGTGASPQSETYSQSVGFDDPNSVRNLSYNPDFKSALEYIDLVPRAKITDVINSTASSVMSKIVSHKFVNIISSYNCSDFNLYPVKLKKSGRIYDNYYLLKFNEDSFIHINNTKSDIQLNFEGTVFDFAKYSKEQFLNLFDSELKGSRFKGKLFFFHHFKVKKVVFDKGFDKHFFSLKMVPTPHPGIYLSETLVEDLIKNGITGAEFKPVMEIDDE